MCSENRSSNDRVEVSPGITRGVSGDADKQVETRQSRKTEAPGAAPSGAENTADSLTENSIRKSGGVKRRG